MFHKIKLHISCASLWSLLVIAALTVSCSSSGSGNKSEGTGACGVKEELQYACGFEIEHFNGYTVVRIADPWKKRDYLQEYVLVEIGAPLPDGLPKGTLVRTPVQNIIMYTTIHASIWEELNSLNAIAGICEPEYLTSQKAKELVADGTIADCGKASSPNVEKIMEIGGGIIIASPFEHGGYGQAEKLGIPIFESADYMENHPLGRVEWMKVFGLLSGKRDMADSIFNAVSSRYNELKELASTVETRPLLMTERKYGSTWFIAGGASYMAQMYSDAGADYIFRDNTETGSVPLSFENVYDTGLNSDFWLFKYDMPRPMTYADLRSEYKPYEDFAPFRNRKIYTCNTVVTPYYEYIAIHPDYILEDFVGIFHPHLLPNHKLRCYAPMQ